MAYSGEKLGLKEAVRNLRKTSRKQSPRHHRWGHRSPRTWHNAQVDQKYQNIAPSPELAWRFACCAFLRDFVRARRARCVARVLHEVVVMRSRCWCSRARHSARTLALRCVVRRCANCQRSGSRGAQLSGQQDFEPEDFARRTKIDKQFTLATRADGE